MIRLRGLTLRPGEDTARLYALAEQRLGTAPRTLALVRRSVDARRKAGVHFVYTVDVETADEDGVLLRHGSADIFRAPEYRYEPPRPAALPDERPVVVGFGPAGMFAALVLAEGGLRPLVLERGEPVEQRTKKVEALRRGGVLDPESNVQFGEGGAGAFSDGKLTTGVKDERIPWILAQLVAAGAPIDITYEARPHIGTDLLPGVCASLRARIEALGGEVCFGELLDAPISGGPQNIEAGAVTLYTGATETGLERARPVLSAYGDPIVHLGPTGAGQQVKLINNAVFAQLTGAPQTQ